jgi:hypothetical protein
MSRREISNSRQPPGVPSLVVVASKIDWGVAIDAYLFDAARIGDRYAAQAYFDLSGKIGDGMTVVTPPVTELARKDGFVMLRSFCGKDYYVIVTEQGWADSVASEATIPTEVLEVSRINFGRAITAYLHQPEIEGFCLVGRVYLDSKDRFHDGRLIRTSNILEFVEVADYLVAITLTGSAYVLIAPDCDLLTPPWR